MSLKSGSTRSLRLKSCRTSSSTASSHHTFHPALTVTEFQVRLNDSPKSASKTFKSTYSELSVPGSSSTAFRQRSNESLRSEGENKNDAEEALLASDLAADPNCPVTLGTPMEFANPFSVIQQVVKSNQSRRSENALESCSKYEEQPFVSLSTSLTTDAVNEGVQMRRQSKPDPTASVTSNEPEATAVTTVPPSTYDVPQDDRVPKGPVRESKYKLTDKVKQRIKQTNPILSGRVLEHYFKYGKPPFKNFGCTRDSKICRY